MKQPTKDEIEEAFERWLERVCPSGDFYSVKNQFESSSDFLDLFESEVSCSNCALLAKRDV